MSSNLDGLWLIQIKSPLWRVETKVWPLEPWNGAIIVRKWHESLWQRKYTDRRLKRRALLCKVGLPWLQAARQLRRLQARPGSNYRGSRQMPN